MRAVAVLALLAACGGDDGPPPVFPAQYAYSEVRACRSSSDHDLNKIRVLVDDAAKPAYTTRAVPFPEGAIVLKEEYDFADTSCTGEIVQWTVMQKHGSGWTFQKVDPDRHVVTENEARCINCHAQCGQPPDGYDGTCAMAP